MAITKVKTLGITDANVTAAKLATDSVETAKITAANVTNAKLGTDISAAKLTAGTVPDARFPATLPAASGANLTNLNATNLGSGTVPTARLGTGTADSSVFLAGNNTWASAGGGKIGQVVSTTVSTVTSTTSATFGDISGLAVSITPSATTSKVLVFVNLSLGSQAGYSAQLRLMRDSTAICIGTDSGIGGSQVQATWHQKSWSDTAIVNQGMNFLDSPSTTSSISYNVEWRETENTTLYLNRMYTVSDNESYPWVASTITAMEVLA